MIYAMNLKINFQNVLNKHGNGNISSEEKRFIFLSEKWSKREDIRLSFKEWIENIEKIVKQNS